MVHVIQQHSHCGGHDQQKDGGSQARRAETAHSGVGSGKGSYSRNSALARSGEGSVARLVSRGTNRSHEKTSGHSRNHSANQWGTRTSPTRADTKANPYISVSKVQTDRDNTHHNSRNRSPNMLGEMEGATGHSRSKKKKRIRLHRTEMKERAETDGEEIKRIRELLKHRKKMQHMKQKIHGR